MRGLLSAHQRSRQGRVRDDGGAAERRPLEADDGLAGAGAAPSAEGKSIFPPNAAGGPR